MRFPGNRPEGHRARREPFDDLGDRLDLVQGNRFAVRRDLEQTAQVLQLLGLVVDLRRVSLEEAVIGAPHRVLQRADGLRRPDMLLAAQTVGEVPAHIQRIAIDRRVAVGQAVPAFRLFRDLSETCAFDLGRRPREIGVDKSARQADSIENLRPAIGLIGRNAHLRHDLHHALANRLDVVAVGGEFVEPVALLVHVIGQGIEREIWVHGFRAITREEAEIMHPAGFAGLHDEPHVGPQPLADQVVMHRAGRQQGRDRHMMRIQAAVGQNDDVVILVADHALGLGADSRDRRLHCFGFRAVDPVTDVQRIGPERSVDVVLDPANALEIGVGKNRMVDFETLVLSARAEIEQIGTRPDKTHQRHHQLLANRIDRRVRDLGKILEEIIGEHPRLVGKRRQRNVASHRADRVLALLRHRLQEELQILGGVTESLLHIEQGRGVRRHRPDLRRQVRQIDLRPIQPLLIGIGVRETGFQFLVGDDAVLLQIDQQHLARLQPPFPDDLLFGDGRQHADFGRHDDQSVLGLDVARGP